MSLSVAHSESGFVPRTNNVLSRYLSFVERRSLVWANVAEGEVVSVDVNDAEVDSVDSLNRYPSTRWKLIYLCYFPIFTVGRHRRQNDSL